MDKIGLSLNTKKLN